MPDSSVPITAGAGTQIDTRTTSGGDHRQVLVVGNDGDVVAGVEPFGALSVNMGYTTLFYDSWTGPLDTVDKWTVTGTAPTLALGDMTMNAAVSTYNALQTKDAVKPNAGFTLIRNGITLEGATAGTGAGRFWGAGTVTGTPTATKLVTDGIGFEIDQATGALYAVTYTAAGGRNIVATLTRPTDGAIHAYHVYFRVTGAYWYIDNAQVPVASASFPNLDVTELPALLVRQNAATLANAPVFVNVAHLTADTSSQGRSIADPTIGTRMARVTAGGALVVSQAATLGTGAVTNTAPVTAIGTTQVQILAAGTTRTAVLVQNIGSADVFIGATGVTATSYFQRLSAGDVLSLTAPNVPTNALFAISASTGQSVSVGVMT